MSKSTIAVFVVFALIFAVAIPYVALSKEGEADSSDVRVAESDEASKELFATNCGSCHTLARAGTDGVVGPNLDYLLGMGTPEGNEERVLSAIENGINGRMPAGILSGAQAEEVANFVAREAGN